MLDFESKVTNNITYMSSNLRYVYYICVHATLTIRSQLNSDQNLITFVKSQCSYVATVIQ